jgi:hypothetical protein
VGQLEAAGTAQQCKRACLPSAFFASRRGDWRGTTPVRSSSNSDPRTALVASFVIAPMAGRAAQPASGNDTARFLAGMQPGPDSPLLPLIKDRAWQQHAGRFNNIFAKVESRQISRIHTWSQAKLTSPSPVLFYMFSGPDFFLGRRNAGHAILEVAVENSWPCMTGRPSGRDDLSPAKHAVTCRTSSSPPRDEEIRAADQDRNDNAGLIGKAQAGNGTAFICIAVRSICVAISLEPAGRQYSGLLRPLAQADELHPQSI